MSTGTLEHHSDTWLASGVEQTQGAHILAQQIHECKRNYARCSVATMANEMMFSCFRLLHKHTHVGASVCLCVRKAGRRYKVLGDVAVSYSLSHKDKFFVIFTVLFSFSFCCSKFITFIRTNDVPWARCAHMFGIIMILLQSTSVRVCRECMVIAFVHRVLGHLCARKNYFALKIIFWITQF